LRFARPRRAEPPAFIGATAELAETSRMDSASRRVAPGQMRCELLSTNVVVSKEFSSLVVDASSIPLLDSDAFA